MIHFTSRLSYEVTKNLCLRTSLFVTALSVIPLFGLKTAYATVGFPGDTAKTSTVTKPAPFAFGDFTWMNGQNRQKSAILFNQYLTASLYLDVYYNFNFNDPLDNTQTISSTTGRHNEFTLNVASVGFETNYKNALGKILLQTGHMASIVQEADGTAQLNGSGGKGRNLSADNTKLIREATAGYHFDALYGINVEAGIFMSYIGLESYVLQENWSYQRSMVCDFTPFYFTGLRTQIFPSDRFRTELWIINGWQTYGKWNKDFGIGSSNYYRPSESLGFIANFYFGSDQKNNPGRKRFHHDNSILYRYHNDPTAGGISKAAFSLNTHFGFETGGTGAPSDSAYMRGTSFANRIWFNRDQLALTLRADYITNPTRYLAFSPSPAGYAAGDNGYALEIRQFTATFDVMPNDFITFRFEFAHRNAGIPYFAGKGGTTSSDGFQGTAGNFTPDLRKSESRIILATHFRM